MILIELLNHYRMILNLLRYSFLLFKEWFEINGKIYHFTTNVKNLSLYFVYQNSIKFNEIINIYGFVKEYFI